MVDPLSVGLGAVGLYALVVHMVAAYLYATAETGAETVSATEADVLEGDGT